jgi:hypothetical protein
VLVGLGLALFSSGGAPGAPQAPLQLRLLVAKLTWGPEPLTDADVDAAMAPVPGFMSTTSFGKVSILYTQTPWLHALTTSDPCAGDPYAIAFSQRARALVASFGYPVSSYDRLMVLMPESNCQFGGITQRDATILDGAINAGLVVHELGVSLGMSHAGAFSCRFTGTHRFCSGNPYGDPWDVMGASAQVVPNNQPIGDFGALQKARAGWLTPTYVGKAGVYQLAPLEEASALPQALVIRTAGFEYWVDHREAVANDAYLANEPSGYVTTGFELHRITGDPLIAPAGMPLLPDYLVPRGGPKNLDYTPPGSTVSVPNLFALRAVSRTDGVMTVRFRWLDKTKPTAPVIGVVSGANTTASPLTIQFKASTDRGSGVDDYMLSIDNRPAQPIVAPPLPPTVGPHPAQLPAADPLPLLNPGEHSLTLIAVDRAGNRSAAAIVRIHA